MTEQKLPPVTAPLVVSLGLVFGAGVYLAANLPGAVSLGPAVGLLSASFTILAGSLVALAIRSRFAWTRFWFVFFRALLAYGTIASIIEYVFVRNEISGDALAALTAGLALYAIHVATLIAFTVARFHEDAEV